VRGRALLSCHATILRKRKKLATGWASSKVLTPASYRSSLFSDVPSASTHLPWIWSIEGVKWSSPYGNNSFPFFVLKPSLRVPSLYIAAAG
jgi:hypothetical protein